ncbi:hypothetical protein V9K67_21755 [Paraflavisolibacter sp. H34]|uniref:hypothetical protein n=1 Tax=Huijunlia imazamoxiresistens TaxID=3127457 RepID=UPI0030169A19
MKTFPIILAISLALPRLSSAQVVVTDPVLAGVASANGEAQNKRLDDIREKQTVIQRYQALAVAHLKMINDWQDKLYKGLSQVSTALRDLQNLTEVYQVSRDIVAYQVQVAEHAKGNPMLLLVAHKSEQQFRLQAAALLTYIQSVALGGGAHLLMDAGERAAIIQRILRDLRVLRSLAYSAERMMYWAKREGLFKKIIPFASWVSGEATLAKAILASYKF